MFRWEKWTLSLIFKLVVKEKDSNDIKCFCDFQYIQRENLVWVLPNINMNKEKSKYVKPMRAKIMSLLLINLKHLNGRGTVLN